MKCLKCGYILSAFDTFCPRCASAGLHTGPKKEVTPDAPTQQLMALEQCPHCQWLLFPADTVCPSCGAKIAHAKKRGSPSSPPFTALPDSRFPDWKAFVAEWKPVLIGMAVCLGIVVVWLLFFVLSKR